MPDKDISRFPDYTADLSQIIEAENLYIQKHRAVNRISEEEAEEGTWGICFSTGGHGTSILTLGFIQALMRKDFFRRIDYMSTVSAGGFIPGCMSSLLTGEKSSTGKFGVDAKNAPFIAKRPPSPKGKSPTPKQQLNHLKRCRAFLPDIASRTSIRDMLGNWLGGWGFGFFVFVILLFFAVSGHAAFLYWYSDNTFFVFLSDHFNNLSGNDPSSGIVKGWWMGVTEAFSNITTALLSPPNRFIPLFLWLSGLIYPLVFLLYLAKRIRQNDHTSYIAKRVNRFEMWGYISIYLIILVFAFLQKQGGISGLPNDNSFWLVFGYAPAIAFGMLSGVYILKYIHYALARKTDNFEEIRLAFHGMQGAGVMLMFVSVVLPAIYIIATLVGGFTTLVMAVVLFVLGLFFNYRRAKKAGMPVSKTVWIYQYLSNVAAFSIVFLFFATLSKLLLKLFLSPPFDILPERMIYISFAVSVIFILLLVIFSRSDRSNLHYYLKDKLASALLFTEARNTKGHLVNLRNDALLKLHEIGDDNFSGPYHIINACVNVHNSKDHERQQKKGLPFIFSKFYVGSDATHYVKTSVYKDGKTKLIDALANSAAFINPGMGVYSFAAQSFLLNALNLKLGAWVENPLYYRYSKPNYIINYALPNFVKSAMGRFDERSRYVNISEGDHSGDNFGLIPLLQRRCDHIIICDFSVVHDFFLYKDLFAQTNELTKSYGVTRIDLDRRCFEVSEKDQHGVQYASSCIKFGTIYYDNGDNSYLYFIKAVLDKNMPKSLKEYASNHPRFPLDLWPDQSFGENDFEAYRSLGVHLGKSFLKELREDLLSHLNSFIDERIGQIDKEIETIKKTGQELHEQKKGLDIYLVTLKNSIREGKLPAKTELEGLEKTEIEIVKKLNYLRPQLAKMMEGTAKFQLKKEIEQIENELLELRTKKNELLDLLAKQSNDIRDKKVELQKIEAVKKLLEQLIEVIEKQKQQKKTVASVKNLLIQKRHYLDKYIRQKLSNLYEPLPEVKKELEALQVEIEEYFQQLDKGDSEIVKSEIQKIRRTLNDLKG